VKRLEVAQSACLNPLTACLVGGGSKKERTCLRAAEKGRGERGERQRIGGEECERGARESHRFCCESQRGTVTAATFDPRCAVVIHLSQGVTSEIEERERG